MRLDGDHTAPAPVGPGEAVGVSAVPASADRASLGRVFDQTVMRERILGAAVTIVADRGFAACTVREVAEAVGIKAPGLYSHFPSKEAILSEAVSRVLDDFTSNAAAVSGSDPEEELRETVRRHVLYQIENMQLARVADVVINTASAGRVVSSEDYERVLAGHRTYVELVSRRVAAYAPALPPAHVSAATMAIIAMCDGVATWYRADGPFEPDDLADLYWRFTRRMIAEPGAE